MRDPGQLAGHFGTRRGSDRGVGRGPVDRPRTQRYRNLPCPGLSEPGAPGRPRGAEAVGAGGTLSSGGAIDRHGICVPCGTSGSSGAVGRLLAHRLALPQADDVDADHGDLAIASAGETVRAGGRPPTPPRPPPPPPALHPSPTRTRPP